MGGGFYSSTRRHETALKSGYYTKSRNEIFETGGMSPEMDPKGVQIRESRDSEDHPESFPIIIALDVTGSMGHIPHYLVKEGFPHIMESIFQSGVKDPQVMFLGIGDHTCDRAPLQVGQFESSDQLLDKWLTTLFLEGGGGGNDGESYQLAWYFAGNHTSIDSFEKRKNKGVLFTIGDEPVLNNIDQRSLKRIMGNGQFSDYNSMELYTNASRLYDCFHLHIKETMTGSRRHVQDGWKQLLSDNAILVGDKTDVSKVIADTVVRCYNKSGQGNSSVVENVVNVETPAKESDTKDEEIIL